MTSSLGYHHFVSHTGWPIHPQVYGKKSRIWPLLPVFSSPGHCCLLPGSVHLRLLAAALVCPPYNRARLRLHSEAAHVTLCPLSWYDSATFPSVPTPNSAVATQLPCCSKEAPSGHLPQGLCTCSALSLETLPSDTEGLILLFFPGLCPRAR